MKKTQLLVIHLTFWFIVLSLNYSFLLFRRTAVPAESYIYTTAKSALEALVFYLFYLFIVPRFLSERKLGRFLLTTLAYIILFVPFYAVSLTWFNIRLGLIGSWEALRFQFIVASYYVFLYVFLGGLFKLALEGIRSHQQKLQLEQQNVKSELALLRSQINPHFLFNSLNTIHAYVNSSHEKASYSIILLSDIMRYMLYEASREQITLKQEIAYLKSYIELQSLRMEKKDFADFRISGVSDRLLIPPMLLTPFVENAFKHGKKRGRDKGIGIQLEVQDDRELFFTISNEIEKIKAEEVEKSEGMGLRNVKRRLELIYPGKHELQISDNETLFTVRLKIDLA